MENVRSKLVDAWVDAIVTHSQEKHKNIAQKRSSEAYSEGFSRDDHISCDNKKKITGTCFNT